MTPLLYLNKYFIKYRYRLLLGVLIAIASRYLAVKVPEVVKGSIDVAQTYRLGDITVSELKHQLLINILTILGLVLLAGVFTFLLRQTIIVTSRFIEYDLKNEIFQKYERFTMGFYKKNRTGDLMNRISDDVSKVRMYIGPAVMYSINMLILMSIAIRKMMVTDIHLTLYVLIPFPFLSIFVFVLNSIIHRRSALGQEQLSKITTYCQEIFSGIGVIKSFAIDRHILYRFENLALASREKNVALYLARAFFFPGMVLLIGISNLLVIYIGGKHFAAGIISMGTIAEFVLYVNMLTWPVAIIGWVSATLKEASVSQKRINDFLTTREEVTQGELLFDGSFKKIELKKVALQYEDTGVTAIDNVNLSLQQGEKVGIVGKTGSGKTSLLNLLVRFCQPTQGTIQIDGVAIEKFTLESLRKNIVLIPQESFLFSESIADNIRFGKETASMEEVMRVAKIAQIHEDIQAFSRGYETILGERGVTLSGGQKQRLCIARTLLNIEAKVLLFDDVFSAIDNKTSNRIIKAIETEFENKTVIMISHQKHHLSNMERVISLENGRMANR